MHIFIDESGLALPTCDHPKNSPVCCVAALIVPSTQLVIIEQWFTALEYQYEGLIKGKNIDHTLRKKILSELNMFDVFIECVAIDMDLHTSDMITNHKMNRAIYIENNSSTKNFNLVKVRQEFANEIRKISNQLYLQGGLNWRLIELVLRHSTLYYSQKRPEELGAFHWIIDPKEAGKIIKFESLWVDLVLPYLQHSASLILVQGHDYSYLEKFEVKNAELYKTDAGLKLNKSDVPLNIGRIITEHLSFPDDKTTPGLRIVDVISNSIFQTLNGYSNYQVCEGLGKLFFARRAENCISLLALEEISKETMMTRPYRKALLSIESHNRTIWS